jgi:hypothetical protein
VSGTFGRKTDPRALSQSLQNKVVRVRRSGWWLSLTLQDSLGLSQFRQHNRENKKFRERRLAEFNHTMAFLSHIGNESGNSYSAAPRRPLEVEKAMSLGAILSIALVSMAT